jgi:hypothetical protein
MIFLPILLAATLAADPAPAANPVYRELRDRGVPIGGSKRQMLPAPSMDDGLGAAAQQKVLAAIADEDHPLEDLLSKAHTAPFVLKLSALPAADHELVPKSIDLWFIMYGDLEAAMKKPFRQRLLTLGQQQVEVQELSAEDLAARKLSVATAGPTEVEVYLHLASTLFDRVRVEETQRVTLTRAKDSLILAARIDPRFSGDSKFPNQWQPVVDGKPGKAEPYEGLGAYMKITRLAEPAGALFVESHTVLVEPKKWFDGAKLLESKLPTLVQQEVRTLRTELDKASR